MKGQLITFETAKLAAKKGFNPKNGETELYLKNGEISNSARMDWINNSPTYPAPTQTKLRKWLREEHDKHLFVRYDGKTNKGRKPKYVAHLAFTKIVNSDRNDGCFPTYEDALEAVLVKRLEEL